MTLVRYKQAPVMGTSPVDRLASEIFGKALEKISDVLEKFMSKSSRKTVAN